MTTRVDPDALLPGETHGAHFRRVLVSFPPQEGGVKPPQLETMSALAILELLDRVDKLEQTLYKMNIFSSDPQSDETT